MPVAWASIVLLGAAIVVGASATIVVLLANAKTRAAALAALCGLGILFLLLGAGLMLFRTSGIRQPSGVNTYPPAAMTRAPRTDVGRTDIEHANSVMQIDGEEEASKPAPTAPIPPPSEPAVNREDEIAQEITAKAVDVLKAISRALGRVLAEEEKLTTAKKDVAKKLPSPTGRGAGAKKLPSPTGRGAGGEGSTGANETADALTLTLSQGERGPDKRPAWADAPPKRIGDAYQMGIVVGPYSTRAECDAKLPEALQEALDRYVEVCLVGQAAGIRIPADELRRQIVKAEWEQVGQYSVGPMTRLHVLLLFDRKMKDRVLEAGRRAVVAGRLYAVAMYSGAVLTLLIAAFGYLKIDLATGGAYRGRLRLAAVAVILGLAVAVAAAIA